MSTPPPPPPMSGLKMSEFKPPPPSKGRGALLQSIQKGTKLRKVKPSEMKRPKSPRELFKGSSGGSSSDGPQGFVPTGNPMIDEMRRRQLARQQGGGGSGGSAGFNRAPAPQFPLKKAPPVPTWKKSAPSVPSKPSEQTAPKPFAIPARKPPPIPSKPSENNQKAPPPAVPSRRPPPSVPSRKPPSVPNKKPPPPVPTKPGAPTPPARRKPPPPPVADKPSKTPPKVPPSKPQQTSISEGNFEMEGRFKFRTDLPPPPQFKGIKKVYRGQKKNTPAMSTSTPVKKAPPPAVPQVKPVQSTANHKPAPAIPAKKPVIPPPVRRAPPPPGQSKANPDEVLKKLEAKLQEHIARAVFEKCIPIRDIMEKIKAADPSSPELKRLLDEAEKLL